jgi:outer membrane immunogenic protein
MMKRFLLVAAAALVAAPALGADLRMPVKAPPPVLAPVATWTGFYIGINGGWSWGRARTDSVSVAVPGFAAVAVPVGVSSNLDGGLIGGQIGYNWQVSNWVWGLEGDGQWSDQRHTDTVVCGVACTGTAAAAFAASFSQKIEAFGTFRGRVGFLATPDILFYGTGGLAVASFRTSASATVTAAGLVAGVSTANSQTRAGWTVGAGMEGMFAPHWSAKLEYLFADYGRFNNNLVFPGAVAIGTQTHVSDNIIRAGVNYHF